MSVQDGRTSLYRNKQHFGETSLRQVPEPGRLLSVNSSRAPAKQHLLTFPRQLCSDPSCSIAGEDAALPHPLVLSQPRFGRGKAQDLQAHPNIHLKPSATSSLKTPLIVSG